MFVAHVAGIPVEESLGWLVPLSGLGLAGTLAWVRGYVRRARRGGVGT